MLRQRQRIPSPESDQVARKKSIAPNTHGVADSTFGTLTPRQAAVMRVQQTYGNAAVGRMLAAQRSRALTPSSSIQRWPWDDDSSSEGQSESGGDSSANEFSWPWESGEEAPRVTQRGRSSSSSPSPQPQPEASDSGESSSESPGVHSWVVPSGVGGPLAAASTAGIEAEGYAQKLSNAASAMSAEWGALEGSTMTQAAPPGLFAEGQIARASSNGLISAAGSAKNGLDSARAKLENAYNTQN